MVRLNSRGARFSFAVILIFILFPFNSASAAGLISLTTLGNVYSENFDTLVLSGNSSAVPTGWDFVETLTNANFLYSAGTGSLATGDTYSFGSAASSERAFGSLQSGTLLSTIGAQFVNNTGIPINSITISYTGEQWRLGALGRPDRLDFQLSTDATSLSTGSWVNYSNLNFTAPVTAGSVGALNGNNAANRTAISWTISGLAIPNGAAFWIRWTDINATGSDDGLAVDDFSLTPFGGPPIISSIMRANPNLTNAASIDFLVTFSQSVTGVDNSDFSLSALGITGASVSSVSGSGASYTVTVNSGTGSGTLRMDVVDDDTIINSASNPLGGVGLGNGNFSSGEIYSIDKIVPTISITSTAANPTNVSPIPVAFTFSESVTGFISSDISVVNGSVNSFSGSGSSYTANIIPSIDGSMTIDVLAAVAIDQAGNTNTTAPQFSITYDSVAPTVQIEQASTQPDPTGTSPIHFTATFSEPIDIATFTAGDINLGGSATPAAAMITQLAPNNGTIFDISVSGMNTSGQVTASLLAGVVRDAAGNGNTASDSLDNSIFYDITAPIVSSIQRINANPSNMTEVRFRVTFSKSVSGVGIDDFSISASGITGASATAISGSGTTYIVTAETGSGSGALRLDVEDDDSIMDSVSNRLGGLGLNNGSFNSGETYTIIKSAPTSNAGLIVNEVSNGSSGNKEWVELVVVGSNPTVDLSGWIIDDNNGDFDSFAVGKGIATGHLRFADPLPACTTGQALSAAPVGARIVVYNSNDVEGTLASFPNDPCDSNSDGVYFLPVGPNPNNTGYVQQCTTHPRISPTPTNPDYAGCVYSSPAITWEGMVLLNTSDVIQTRQLDGIFYHGFAYGNLIVPPAPNFPDGNPSFNVNSATGTNMAYQFQCGNYFSNSTNQFIRLNSGLVVPGLANNASNAAFIRSLQLETFNYDDLNDIENCRVEPVVTMSFSQPQVAAGQQAQLSITLTNPYEPLDGYSLDLLGVQFTNHLPSGLSLSGPNPVSNSCGGIFSDEDGASSFSLSGVALPTLDDPESNSCTIIVNVTGRSRGSYINEILAGDVTSVALGVSGGSNLESVSTTLLVTGSSNTDENSDELPGTLPKTGFSPGVITVLPEQPLSKIYDSSQELILEIPEIGLKTTIVGVPISENGWDLTWLGNQAGWLNGTVFPTWPGNSVITAHVWDALDQPGPFANLYQLKYGDQIIIHAWGQSYIYEVRNIDLDVDPNDTSVLRHEDFPWLTLITCHGFNSDKDIYDKRFVLRAIQVSID